MAREVAGRPQATQAPGPPSGSSRMQCVEGVVLRWLWLTGMLPFV